jgi:GPI mannosyltransferase 3
VTFSAPSRLRVWHVLALAFAARFAVGLANDSVLYPDETMQYLEQAHRLVFGPGMVPWEYEYGVRPWVVPMAIGAVLRVLQALSLDTPAVYQPVVEAVLCAASLTLPYAAYRLTTAMHGADAGRLALLATAFWYELVSYGHRATIDALTAYVAFGALALLFATPTRGVRVACGALAGLAFVLRFQVAPMIAVVAAIGFWRWRAAAWLAAAAGLAVIIAGGALDAYTWGVWFSAIRVSVALSGFGDLSSIFGTYPFYWYGIVLVVLSGGLAIAGALGLVLTWRSSWPLIAVGLATLVGFSAIGHKQTRFVFVLTPIWLIGLAVLASERGRVLAARLPALRRLAPEMAVALIAAFAVISPLGLFDRLPLERRYLRPNIARDVVRDAYRAVAAHDDVIAVLDASGASGWYLTPYYDLHHDVPLYWPLSNGFGTVTASPSQYVSHVIAPRAAAPPVGFREVERVGGLVIWRRRVDPPFTDEPFGYERRIHALQPVKTPPIVTPRW